MAKHVLTDAFVSINGVDMSDHVEQLDYTMGINAQAAAAMGEIQDYDMPGTITISPITVTFYQDFAASETYATIMPMVSARSVVTLIVKPTSGADSATNPAFTIPVFVGRFGVVTGSRGQRHMVPGTFQPAGALVIDIT